ncbi:MAG: hypothetical protein P8Y13_03985 [Deinococcales bacterium]
MTAPSRYQSQELYLQQGDISCYRGVDPLTGLAVLIYTFPDRPTVAVGGLESENVPGILVSTFDDNSGQVVTAYSPHYGLVAPGESVVDDHFTLEALRAVRDAARTGVVHGDLRAGRLLYAQGHVLIEGYGVPWRPVDPDVTAPEVAAGGAPSLAADVYAVAATLLLLGGDNLSNEVAGALRSALAADARKRPAAATLFADVRRACGGTLTPPPRSFEELTLPTGSGAAGTAGTASAGTSRPGSAPPSRADRESAEAGSSLSATRSDFQLDLDFELDVGTPMPEREAFPASGQREPGAVQPPATRPPAPANELADEPEPITLNSDPGLAPHQGGGRSPRDSDPGFVKDLPPGATYRAGKLDDTQPPAPIRMDLPPAKDRPRRSWRGPLLVILALVAAGGLASLAFLNQGALAPASQAPSAVDYILSVQVQPTDLPPVDLYVVKSPSGSSTPAGTILCRAPCKVVLDRRGEWQFRGEFQNRVSKVADVKLPGPQSITIEFPPRPAGGSSSTSSGH